MNDNSENERKQFFNRLKKPNEMVRSRAMNERNEKSRTCSSLFIMFNATWELLEKITLPDKKNEMQ